MAAAVTPTRALVAFIFLIAGCAADTACIARGGVCQTDSIACSGGYVSGLCRGLANRRCCLAAAGSRGTCPLVTFSYAGSRFTGNGAGARVHPDFMPKMRDMNSFATECGVTIVVTSDYRRAPATGNQWNAQRSCHMIGRAIDMNIRTSGGALCNSRCLAGYRSLTQTDSVACFLKKIRSHPTLHWGISFDDPVHIDDRTCSNAAAYNSAIAALRSC